MQWSSDRTYRRYASWVSFIAVVEQHSFKQLDKELEARGHRYERYYDDCSIYVKSEKSATRVLTSITEFIEKKLKLKVNRAKSKVSHPMESMLLGFSFYRNRVKWELRIEPKSVIKIKEKLKTLKQRKAPGKEKDKITKIEATIVGWVNYFRIAKAK